MNIYPRPVFRRQLADGAGAAPLPTPPKDHHLVRGEPCGGRSAVLRDDPALDGGASDQPVRDVACAPLRRGVRLLRLLQICHYAGRPPLHRCHCHQQVRPRGRWGSVGLRRETRLSRPNTGLHVHSYVLSHMPTHTQALIHKQSHIHINTHLHKHTHAHRRTNICMHG